MRLIQRVAFSLFLAGSVLTASSCKKDESTTGEAAQMSASGFANGYNKLIDQPQGLLKRYFDEIAEEGPDPESPAKLFPDQTWAEKALTEARTAFASAKSSVPASMKDIPALADAALAAATKLVSTYTAAQKYYEAENYKDDKFAKGKELHAEMLAARKDFQATTNALSNALDAVEDVQAESEIKKHGKDTYGYWYRHFNMVAKRYISMVSSANDLEGGIKAASDGFAAVDEAMTAFTAFLATKKGGKAESMFSGYANAADRYYASAKKMQRFGAEKPDEATFSSAVDAQISAYNSLLTMSSSMSQLESQDLLK